MILGQLRIGARATTYAALHPPTTHLVLINSRQAVFVVAEVLFAPGPCIWSTTGPFSVYDDQQGQLLA